MTAVVDTFVKNHPVNFHAVEDCELEEGVLQFEERAGDAINVKSGDDIGGLIVYFDADGRLNAWYDYENGVGFAPAQK